MKCQRRGQREPNCDSARSNCNVVCVDCAWPCATLVAVTMCGTAEATKDHLNEHSLCYSLLEHSSQLGSQAPSRDRSTRAESGLCVESVWCVSYGSTMLRTWNQGQGSDWSVRGGIDTGPLVGDVQCSIWPMPPGGAVCPARERDSCGDAFCSVLEFGPPVPTSPTPLFACCKALRFGSCTP